MAVNQEKYQEIIKALGTDVQLVAVSKTKPIEDILALYELGQRDFGENYVQELVDKQAQLPKDIRWHFIGHLQSNKVKYIVPFVHLIHGVESAKLLREIDKQAAKQQRVVPCLLQVYIAREETKFGLDVSELDEILGTPGQEGGISGILQHVRVLGLMGMASFTEDLQKVRAEFKGLRSVFERYFQSVSGRDNSVFGRDDTAGLMDQPILSMGMSGDYTIAIEEGSNMVRIGSLLFGERNYQKS